MTEMNGAQAAVQQQDAAQAQRQKDCEDTARFLEEIARDARAGHLVSVAVVAAGGPGQVTGSFTPRGIMELYVGLDALQDQLKLFMAGRHPIQQQQKQSRIIRAGGLPDNMPPMR